MKEGLIKFEEKDEAVFFGVRVVPRASKSEIVGEIDGALKVRLCSPPVDGAANAELIKMLAREFGVSRGRVEIVSGQNSRTKRIRITGATVDEMKSRLF
ncbi:MAG TPA: DUF167 domain-containing protein [Pyrinomonadaceae bacterium]|nr:DUF167 domain-containing protein [Pyrinomonadaceae bacterium]